MQPQHDKQRNQIYVTGNTHKCAAPEVESKKSVAIILWVHVENGSKFTRGKKAVREKITWMLLTSYQGQKLNDSETRIMIQFADDADLKEQIVEMRDEIHKWLISAIAK